MKSTKNKEKELLIKNIEICQNRENQQKQQYHKLTMQLQEKRYDYVNQKNPLSLKIDQQSLKPLLNDLIDFTTDMMSLEDKYFDEKEQQTRNLIQLYQSQLDSVIIFLDQIQENIEETEHQVKQLELEYNEIIHRINLKQEQVNDTMELRLIIFNQELNKQIIKQLNNIASDNFNQDNNILKQISRSFSDYCLLILINNSCNFQINQHKLGCFQQKIRVFIKNLYFEGDLYTIQQVNFAFGICIFLRRNYMRVIKQIKEKGIIEYILLIQQTCIVYIEILQWHFIYAISKMHHLYLWYNFDSL